MSDTTDYDLPGRPSTAQPAPEHVPGGVSVHDLVITDAETRMCPLTAGLVGERRAFGLRKYKTVLQVDEPNRAADQDLLEELGDALAYARRGAELGMPGMQLVYDRLLGLTEWAARRWYRPPTEDA